MKKTCDILLTLIAIAIIIVITLIIVKQLKSQENEGNVSKIVEQIKQDDIPQQEDTKEMQIEYKGYKVLGIIKIPKIDLEYPILESTTNESMKISITKFWGNGVNQIGNLSLAGHNNYNGTMFGKTKKLEIDDVIELTDMYGITKQYKIYNKYITDPNDISVIEIDEFGTRQVTLITCSNGNKERLIIKAREAN